MKIVKIFTICIKIRNRKDLISNIYSLFYILWNISFNKIYFEM